jgi:PAS domain S-box-containing protein
MHVPCSILYHLVSRFLWGRGGCWCLLLWTLGAWGAPHPAEILVIHSYHPGYQWTDSEQYGIESILRTLTPAPHVQVEYLDAYRITTPTYLTRLAATWDEKFRGRRFDVILSTDDPALAFLRTHGGTLFPDTPLVFCGINNYHPDLLPPGMLVTGIAENVDVTGTLSLALRLHPHTRHVLVIGDSSLTYQANRAILQASEPRFPALTFHYLENRSLTQLLAELPTMPRQSIVLLLAMLRGEQQELLPIEEATPRLADHCPYPIYSLWDFFVGHGAVGGRVVTGQRQGEQAAQRALALLQAGTRVPTAVGTQHQPQYLFDSERLQRFNIAHTALPPGAQVINRSPSRLLISHQLLWGVSLVLAGLISLVSVLWVSIAHRKQIELRLRRTQSFLTSLIEHLPAIVFLKDARTLAYVSINAAGEMLFGFAREAMLGKTDHDIFPQDQADAAFAIDQRVLQEKTLIEVPVSSVLTRTGTRLIHAKSLPLLDETGMPTFILGIAEDITDRQTMEEQLRTADKLASLGVLTGGIAHDFNNLLAAILGNLSIAREANRLDAVLVGRLAEAEKACLRARDLTQQLMTFASGGGPIKHLAILADVIRDSAGFVLAGSRSRCVLRLPETLWPVEMDPGQISQVVQNLVLNADQVMTQGGNITVAADNITLGEESTQPLPAGAYVRVRVTDQGPGIPFEHLPHLFDPYFTTKEAGRGLGLATSYRIVQSHGGYLTVDSHPGHGTTFTFFLPATPEAVPPAPVPLPTTALTSAGRHILVMDDEDSVRDTVADMLMALGFTVKTARDGSEAIQLYRDAMLTTPFDAVIMDLTIRGGMDGRDAIQVLRTLDPHVRAIVSSGYSTHPIMSAYQDYGFLAVLMKPYTIDQLRSVLTQVLEGTSTPA